MSDSKQHIKLYGLIGFPLEHSFSQQYFTDKFKVEKYRNEAYQNFPIADITHLPKILSSYPNLVGFNVTSPYKRQILPYLDELSPLAQKVGAVNTVAIRDGRLIGYNTDVIGFKESLSNHLVQGSTYRALVLGTGGASAAVCVALDELKIPYIRVSRTRKEQVITYAELSEELMQRHSIIINTTPLGTYPNIEAKPAIAYPFLTQHHLLFDLVYNPKETAFLKSGKKAESSCINGIEMLILQAEAAYKIWNPKDQEMKEILPRPKEPNKGENPTMPTVDIHNTEIAFAYKSDKELKSTSWLFKMMSKSSLVNVGSKLTVLALKMHFPFIKSTIKKTIYKQFCGGTTLLNSLPSIEKLESFNTLTILDYSSEGKDDEADLNLTMNEIIRAIDFAATNRSIPVVSVKVTGLVANHILEKMFSEEKMTMEDLKNYRNFVKRMDNICHTASKKGLEVYFDAEETWVQDGIDHVVMMMMRRYNKEKPIVYNTYQLYRHDRLKLIMKHHETAVAEGYFLGVKTVRGAYMDKERALAKEKGCPSPIHVNKEATDQDYDLAIRYCLDNIDTISLCNATHNAASCVLHVEYLEKHGIPKDHPHQIISQLFGMSDNITFNMAKAGYRVAKYLPYGPVKDVIPYLIRRAQENTSVTGDMTRERQYVEQEVKRRGI